MQIGYSPFILGNNSQVRSCSNSNLRSTSTTVSLKDAIDMIRKKGFYEKQKNNSGGGFPNKYELRANGKIVVDHSTNLMWEQSGSENNLTYIDAHKYVTKLNQEKFASYDNWRLPTLEEAMALMETKKYEILFIDPIFDNKQKWIWTADSLGKIIETIEGTGQKPIKPRDPNYSSLIWGVNFEHALCYHLYPGNFSQVRAVRSTSLEAEDR